jgi:uncharacterized membrane protein
MPDSRMPIFPVAICFGSGILLVALGVPLWLRRIPPNLFYGARFRSALADDAVWYEVNALAGRNLVAIGSGYLVLLALALTLGHTWSWPLSILVPTVLLVVALAINTFLLYAAGRQLGAASIKSHTPSR